MQALSNLKAFVFSLRASDDLGADQINALRTLIDETSMELQDIKYTRLIDDLTSFADLDLFPRLHAWIEAKMTEMMEPAASIHDETVVELLICMSESTTLFFYCLGATAVDQLRESLRAVADKILEEEKMKKAFLWAILVNSVKGLAGLLAVMSRLSLRVRDGFLPLNRDLPVFVFKRIKELSSFISIAGYLSSEGSFTSLLPLVPTSVHQGLAQSCLSLAAHFRHEFFDIKEEVKTRRFWYHYKKAITWYGDLVSFLLEKHPFIKDKDFCQKEMRPEYQRLFQVLMETFENLVTC
jgi:hypothetical protein